MPTSDNELGKALNLLIHDVRAPLGVANGYLRLLKEHRLPSADEQERALAQALESLGRVSRLCTDASAYLSTVESPAPAEVAVSGPDLARRIGEAVKAAGLEWIAGGVPVGSVKVTRADIVASAIATILATSRRATENTPDLAATSAADDRTLYLLVGTGAQRAALMADARQPVDPWRGGHGLALPVACLQIEHLAGSVWTADAARPGIAVALPVEVPTP